MTAQHGLAPFQPRIQRRRARQSGRAFAGKNEPVGIADRHGQGCSGWARRACAAHPRATLAMHARSQRVRLGALLPN